MCNILASANKLKSNNNCFFFSNTAGSHFLSRLVYLSQSYQYTYVLLADVHR